MPEKKKHKDFESAVARLESITEELESGEATLEESIELYSEGLAIAKECHDKLAAAEKKIKVIARKNDITVEEDFDAEEADE
jgi:exodeoxyribonuclease VII small subunit